MPTQISLKTLLLCAAVATLVAPASASAGTAISSVPNLPSGSRAGSDVTVNEAGIAGHVVFTQTFNGADFGAIAQVRLIRLSPNCGPGPSVGNPGFSGPAINNPEIPCTNPDIGVFGDLSATGTGSQQCAGTTFAITAPDAQGQVDLLPNFPVYLRNGETCDISFTFTVLKQPTKDTFPNADGMHTASVSSVRSEIVSDPGNPAGVGLQAAGLGSGDATLVNPRDCSTDPSLCLTDCTTNPTLAGCTTTYDCTTNPSLTGCDGTRAEKKNGDAKSAAAKMNLAAGCVRSRIRASVQGSGISKVTYLLDGRVLKVVKGKSPFKLNAPARGMGGGAHRLTASVAYKNRATPSRVISKRLARCADPNFTG